MNTKTKQLLIHQRPTCWELFILCCSGKAHVDSGTCFDVSLYNLPQGLQNISFIWLLNYLFLRQNFTETQLVPNLIYSQSCHYTLEPFFCSILGVKIKCVPEDLVHYGRVCVVEQNTHHDHNGPICREGGIHAPDYLGLSPLSFCPKPHPKECANYIQCGLGEYTKRNKRLTIVKLIYHHIIEKYVDVVYFSGWPIVLYPLFLWYYDMMELT